MALALVDALVESADRQLTGKQVDAVIETATARETLRIEHAGRSEWAHVQQSAADFAAHGLEG